MAKPTNDFKPVTFEREVDGKRQTREATNPSDAVALKFDGWRQVKTTKASSGGGSTTAGSKS